MPNIGPLELVVILVWCSCCSGPSACRSSASRSARACASSRTPSPARTRRRRGAHGARGRRSAAAGRRGRPVPRLRSRPSRAPSRALRRPWPRRSVPSGTRTGSASSSISTSCARRLIICGRRVRRRLRALPGVQPPDPHDHQQAPPGDDPEAHGRKGRGSWARSTCSTKTMQERPGARRPRSSRRSRRELTPAQRAASPGAAGGGRGSARTASCPPTARSP